MQWVARNLGAQGTAEIGTPSPPARAPLKDRLSLTIIAGHPDRSALADHVRPAFSDWQDQNWVALGERLAQLDHRRMALPSGERMAPALGQALFRHAVGARVCQMIDRGQSVGPVDLPDSLFAPLDRALTRPDTPAAVHLLGAQLHLETGWARRGETHAEFTTPDARAAATAQLAQARRIIEGNSARCATSAYHAELDYRLRAVEGCSQEDLTEAVHRWRAADPRALTPHAVHGLHLLPRWYGSEEALESYAGQAWAETHDTLGAAAYAACHLSALESDVTVLLCLEPETLHHGLIDMIQQSEDPDLACNMILRTLWDLSEDGFGTGGRDTAPLRRARTDLRAIFTDLARHALGPVMPDVWGRGWTEDRIHTALSEAFASDLAEGRQVAIGMEGVVISDPA